MQALFSPRRQAFINLYVDALFVDGKPAIPNATQIAIDAGYSENGAQVTASQLLSFPMVQEAIRERLRDIATSASIDIQQIIQRWADIATADPRKLVTLRRLNCRYCYGIDHKYQWDADEYARAAMQALADDPEGMPPLMEGGDGWNRTRKPHPYCPKCQGEGEDDVFVADIDKLEGPEKYLYAGIKMTRYGPEIQMHSQMEALANLAKCMGAFVERREHTGKNGKPIAVASVNVEVPVDPQAASKLYQMLMEGKAE